MGEKGSKLTGSAVDVAGSLVDVWKELGDITFKKMFGGCGLFASGSMFALVDSSGTPHLKADSVLAPRFLDAGSEKHGRMPYFSIPEAVMQDPEELRRWAEASIEIALNK